MRIVKTCCCTLAVTLCVAAVRAEVVPLDGTWQAEVTPALPARTRYIFVEISDVTPNKLASIEEIEIH